MTWLAVWELLRDSWWLLLLWFLFVALWWWLWGQDNERHRKASGEKKNAD